MKQMTSATANGVETFLKTTRRPVGFERRLRTSFLQQWFNLSDSAVEEMPCTTQRPCGPSWALSWGWNRSQTRPRSAGFTTCGNSWAGRTTLRSHQPRPAHTRGPGRDGYDRGCHHYQCPTPPGYRGASETINLPQVRGA